MYTRPKGGRRGDDPRRARLGTQVAVWSRVSKAPSPGGLRRAGPGAAASRWAGLGHRPAPGGRSAAALGGAPAPPALIRAGPVRAVVFDVGEVLIDETSQW